MENLKLIMPKNNGSKEVFEETISIIYNHDSEMKVADFVAEERQAYPEADETSLYHKTVMPRYFGLLVFNPLSSRLLLTEMGTKYARANSNEEKIEIILDAIESNSFGRNNNAVDSFTNIEAPIVFLKVLLGEDRITSNEFGCILYLMDKESSSLKDAKQKVMGLSDCSSMKADITSQSGGNKYFDVKFNKLFEDLGVVHKEEGKYYLNSKVKEKYGDKIKNLLERRYLYVGEEVKSTSALLPTCRPRTRKKFSLNQILYGAPGTGKTYTTAKYAVSIIENKELNEYDEKKVPRAALMEKYNKFLQDGQIIFTTFHQNYGYEDFIQGIRPNTSEEGISFKLKDGIFKRLSNKALHDPDNDYAIIIDEINRANISKVFGELITLIEDDKRWGEQNAFSITLPSGETFVVPNNLYIIGTMNSADKSIALIDTALRRRFKFVEVPPNAELIVDIKLQDLFIKLNETLRNSLDSSDLLVGHAYFIGKQYSDLETILNDNVIPLLYEYYFGDEPSVYNAISAALGTNSDYNIIHNTSGKDISRIRIEKK